MLIGSQGYAEVENCDISFNHESGLWVRGRGRVANNVIWGNRRHAVFLDRYDDGCVFEAGAHARPPSIST